MKKNFILCCFVGLMALFAGCASLDVTAKKRLEPVAVKQAVSIGVQANGDRLLELFDNKEESLIRGASGQLFEKVQLLPKDSKFLQPKDIQSKYGVDYILTISIGDINVSGDLNPYWFASLPLLIFKVYAPIVTFQPEVSLDVTLRDARSGELLIQKQVVEASMDHYAPKEPGEKVRKLVSVAINNATVTILKDAQKSIAASKSGK